MYIVHLCCCAKCYEFSVCVTSFDSINLINTVARNISVFNITHYPVIHCASCECALCTGTTKDVFGHNILFAGDPSTQPITDNDLRIKCVSSTLEEMHRYIRSDREWGHVRLLQRKELWLSWHWKFGTGCTRMAIFERGVTHRELFNIAL